MSRKKNLIELSEMIKEKSVFLNKNIMKLLIKDNDMSEKVAIELLAFCSIADEVYCRLIQREKGHRPRSKELINEMKYANVSQSLIESLYKIKRIRNTLAHSVDMKETISGIYQPTLKGLGRAVRFQERILFVSENIIEDVEYSYMSA